MQVGRSGVPSSERRPHFPPLSAVWLATQNHSTLVTETTVVPFLPVNPEYSSTRNQARRLLPPPSPRRCWIAADAASASFSRSGTAEAGQVQRTRVRHSRDRRPERRQTAAAREFARQSQRWVSAIVLPVGGGALRT